jgi:hypothetical protein
MLNHYLLPRTIADANGIHCGAVLVESLREPYNAHPAGWPVSVLPFVFDSISEASRFLEVAERVGLNIWPGMAKTDLAQMVYLWRDGAKR